jgi:regulator of RNase E activity RraA
MDIAHAIAALQDVGTAAVSDALDSLTRTRFIMSCKVRKLAGGRIIGPAATIMTAPTGEKAQLTAGIALIDQAPKGSVLVAGLEEETDAALWGAAEIAAAMARGLGGLVGDGAVRASTVAAGTPFGVYGTNATPAAGFGRLKTMATNTPVSCGGVDVTPGDLIIADDDGVIVVPAARIAEIAELAPKYEQRNRILIDVAAREGLSEAIKRHWTI